MRDRGLREIVRRLYRGRCGYCGAHETEAGTELEVDHFQPRSLGGDDSLENLVYCCTTCNRLKSDYWARRAGLPQLLHPQQTNLADHYYENADGLLVPFTERGAFHIGRLQLNRPPLVALRRGHQRSEQQRSTLSSIDTRVEQLEESIRQLTRDQQEILRILRQFTEDR